MAISKNSAETTDVLIPTYDNIDQLTQAMQSILSTNVYSPVRIIVVNNGEAPLEQIIQHGEEILFLKPEKNLGWTGGLKFGLEHSKSKYVVFANDDIFIPIGSKLWLRRMINDMENYPAIAAEGGSSNLVMGSQNMLAPPNQIAFPVPFLIGFCMVVRRSHLDKVGGIDKSFNTGDDLDLSIRFRKAGYHLVCRKDVFIYHHGFQTGEKLYGKPDKPGGWNSRKMQDDTNKHLIQKHGFLAWWQMMTGRGKDKKQLDKEIAGDEATIVKKYIKGRKIVELGCGASKTVKQAVGVDIIPKGEPIPYMDGLSVADKVADIQKSLPFKEKTVDCIIARHILEHCVDVIQTLENWKCVLKKKGRLIITVPDEKLDAGIPMNPEHVHAFTPDSLKNIGLLLGLKKIALEEKYNGISFTIVFEKL